MFLGDHEGIGDAPPSLVGAGRRLSEARLFAAGTTPWPSHPTRAAADAVLTTEPPPERSIASMP